MALRINSIVRKIEALELSDGSIRATVEFDPISQLRNFGDALFEVTETLRRAVEALDAQIIGDMRRAAHGGLQGQG